MNIVVMYSCTVCGVRNAQLEVQARESPEVDVVKWVEGVVIQIARHHCQRHPHCIAKELHDLKIPIDGAEWVGGPAIS